MALHHTTNRLGAFGSLTFDSMKCVFTFLVGCDGDRYGAIDDSRNSANTSGGSQVEIRQMQTRIYESLDKRETLRSILATLQDLGFVVRANARVNDRLIDDPGTYQDFFAVLDKAMFVTRHNVD